MSDNRPSNVPDGAVLGPDGLWSVSEESGAKRDVHFYDSTGFKVRELYFESGVLTMGHVYHAGGFARLFYIDWAGKKANTGVAFVKDREKVAGGMGPGFPELPSPLVAKVEFELEGVQADAPFAYAIVNPVYRDEGGSVLPEDGLPKAPRKGAVLVKAGKTLMWRHGKSKGRKRDGRWTYYPLKGKKVFEEHYDGGERTKIVAYGKKKDPLWEWRPGEWIRVRTADGVLELQMTSDERTLALRGDDETVARATLDESTTAEGFVRACQQVFAPFIDLDTVDVHFDSNTLVVAELERFDEVLEASVVAMTSGGDEVLVIEAPVASQGHVYVNFHDEGLHALEMLDDYVEEQGLDGIDDKQELLEQLPFFQNETHTSLRAAFAALEVVPRNDPRELLRDLAPLSD